MTDEPAVPPAVIAALLACREAEKLQALFYRALAAEAEERGDAPLSERLQQLHADEQHHFSRLTARLLELGAATPDLAHLRADFPNLADWEPAARAREAEEVARYEALLTRGPDTATASLLERILDVERHHLRELGGKWTLA